VARLRTLIGVDTENAKAFVRLTEKIRRAEIALGKLDRDIAAAENADGRIKELLQNRKENYAAVFDGIIEEENELSALYQPLKARLEEEVGALGKLSFSIRRSVDVAAWVKQGESFIDLRKAGPFRGQGALLAAAKADLLPAWESGTSTEVADAMAKFREANERAIFEQR